MKSLFGIGQKYALIVLNNSQPISESNVLEQLWKHSTVKMCADGGANRIKMLNKSMIPDFIVGDFDSILPETISHYKNAGKTQFKKIINEETADVEKCIQFVRDSVKTCKSCILYGFSGGLIDKELNCFHLVRKYVDEVDVMMFSERSFAVLLKPGINEFKFKLSEVGPRCGILPLFCTVSCNSKGLQWDLRGEKMEFGKFISVSNRFDPDEDGKVVIETDNYAFFTSQIQR